MRELAGIVGRYAFLFANLTGIFSPQDCRAVYAKVISTEKLFPPYFEERILKLCKVVYVVSPVTYADTGEETVTWTGYPLADVPKYYTSSKKSLCAFAEVNGERKVRYKRLVNMKISAEHGLMMGTSQTTFAPDTVPTQDMEDMPVRHLLLIMATAVVIQLWQPSLEENEINSEEGGEVCHVTRPLSARK